MKTINRMPLRDCVSVAHGDYDTEVRRRDRGHRWSAAGFGYRRISLTTGHRWSNENWGGENDVASYLFGRDPNAEDPRLAAELRA